MSIHDPVIESRLTEAANRWKNLRFVELAATLGSAVLAVLLLLGLANVFAGLPAAFVVSALVLGLVGGFVAVFFLALILAVSTHERSRLADAWERAYAPLLDRLNTLVHLESEPGGPWTDSYARRIEAQAHEVLAGEWLPAPFPSSRPLLRVLVFLVLLFTTYTFYLHYKPWQSADVPPPMPAPAAVPEPALELPPPKAVEEETTWGEVRITQPGADLAVTPAEDVPIQIEAASNRPLKSVEWFTAVNDGPEKAHPLPDPEEPLFAAYKQAIRPKELGLDDWDVVTYYARATTKEGEAFQSDVYFVEVRPFRQDLLQETGGEASVPYELFNELTGLIEQQQDVIRRTHRGQAAGDAKGSLPESERVDLAKAEDGLAKASEHLAARFDAALKDQGIDDPSRKLGEAKAALGQAANKLRDDELNEARARERDALARLVAARKRFKNALDRTPDAFPPLKDEKRAQAPSDMLEKIAEFRDEAQAAQDFVRKTLDEQRKISQPARALRAVAPKLADRQESLRKALEEFRAQHPKPFEESGKACDAAGEAMRAAAEAMKKGPAMQSGGKSDQAAAKLQALADALKNAAHDRQLADAYRLKQELDAQIDRLRAAEKDAESLTSGEQKAAAEQAKALARQLKKAAETSPTREDFGPQLRKALDDKAMSDLESRCQGLGQAEGAGAKAQGAKGVRESLEAIAGAFEKSAPPALTAGRNGADPLKPAGQDALDRGLAQLESLAGGKPGDGKAAASPSQVAKLRAEAMDNLQAGVLGRFGHNERSTALVRMLEREVRDRAEPIDARVIGRLRQALEERRVELSGAADATEPEKPKATHVDPSRLPPAYRKAIETYYEKLSERP